LPAAPGAPVTQGAAPLLPDLSAAHFAQVLLIHLAALASLNGELPETATAPLEAQLRREARDWRQAIADRGLGAGLYPAVSQALALITLADGAAGIANARTLIDQAPLLARAEPAEREGVLALLRGFYPRDGGTDAPAAGPARERLVVRELARDDSLLTAVWVPVRRTVCGNRP